MPAGESSSPMDRTTYRNERRFPFCPGCGHGLILNQLDKALALLQIDPKRTVIVTDIGCSGLSDQYFATNAMHGLHGRSVAYATGMKLVDPDLKVIVIIGDGGTGIGLTHLVSAARRNIGITVLVFNNFNFGMTGGEHSVTTPPGGITATTRGGNLERPLDICATVAANGAGFVWRGTSFDGDLAQVMAAAISLESFALLDIWDLCMAYYAESNSLSRRTLLSLRDNLGMAGGLIHQEERAEYARALRANDLRLRGQPAMRARAILPQYQATLDREFRLVIAGSAGGKIRSTAKMVGEAAVLAGLWASQKDDYPTTVQTGYSLSELVISPGPIHFSGIEEPDALIIVSEEGKQQCGRFLRAMGSESRLFVPPEFADLPTAARVEVLDPLTAGAHGRKRNLGLLLVGAALRRLNLFPIAACEETIARGQPATVASENLAVLAQSALIG